MAIGVAVGAKAPEFSLPDQDGNIVTPKSLKGKQVVLYFYPNITIRVQLAEDQPENALIRFEVIETGIGIAPEALQRLFSAFEQADNSMTRKYGGTGLGLAITRKIAEIMGGSAGCSSEPNKGSTFWFTVRLRKNPELCGAPSGRAIITEAENTLKQDYPGMRILLAEAEPVNREVSL